MANNKSIKELIIKVKQQNAIKVSKDIDRISESLLEATEYADLFNQTLSSAKVPEGFEKIITTFERMESSLEEISKQTRYTTNSIGAMRNEAIEMSQSFQDSFTVLSEGLDDLGSDAIRTGSKTEAAIQGVEKATKGATSATNKSTTAQTRLGNALKDTNRQGTNQARNFSKMAASAGGLASTYAVVAANVFALSEGFRLLSEAASVERLEEVSTVISAGIGVSVAGTAQVMREATDYAISYQDALRQAAAATAYGFDTEQIEDFTLVARRAAVVLGVEMTDALNRVIRGISKAEVELLDELGVTVRLNEAFARYASQHNIAASSLNSFQRQQALANEVILKSAQNLGAADDALASTAWERFGSNVSSATNNLLRFISTSSASIGILRAFNNAFDEVSQLSRSDAITTPFTKTLEEAPDALSSIVAYNNLIKEQTRLNKEGAVARAKLVELVKQGVTGEVSAKELATYDTEAMRLADTYNILQAQTTGVRHELDLTDAALNKFADSMGISVDDVALVSDSIQNLSLLSRSLGSDLTTLNNDIQGTATNPYLGMAGSVREAERDINRLLEKNLELDDALTKLKISRDQYNNFGDVKAYVSLLDEQREAALANNKVAAEFAEPAHKTLFLAQQELEQLKEQQQASLAVLDSTTLTVVQREKAFAAEQKVVAAQKKVQALNYTLLQQQEEIAYFADAESKFHRSSIGDASAQLAIEKATLDMMLRQNAAAEALGDVAPYGATQLKDQQDQTTAADSALTTELGDGNVAMQQAALATLSPELATTTTAVYALADAWEVMGSASATAAQTAQAAASALGSGLSAIGGLVSAAAGAAASSIDVEIAAMENSGLTQEEQEAKTKELNKKKIKEQEKYAKASILISTAQGMMLAIATSGNIYAGLALAAVTAAAGAMAYQQASNSAASQLASLGSSTSSTPTSITVGEDSVSPIDVSDSASSSERSETLGDSGVYGRASYGKMHAGNSYLLGEHGKELVTPKVDSTVTRVPEGSETQSGNSSKQVTFNIQAIDAESFAQRMDTLGPVMEEYYEQQGRKLAAD